MTEHVTLLDRIASRCEERLPSEQAPGAAEFARQYFGWVAPEDLEQWDPLDAYGAVLAHWGFARQREPGSPKVRVYNPDFETHGWQSTHTVIEIVNDDMPFLVDSTSLELRRQGRAVHELTHAVMRVRRNARAEICEVLPRDAPVGGDPLAESRDVPPGDDVLAESIIHVEVDRETDPAVLDALRDGLRRILGDVRAAVEDWRPMRTRMAERVAELEPSQSPVPEEELAEARAFLDWADDDHFTFLGYRQYDLAVENGQTGLKSVPGTGLGILREHGQGHASSGFARLNAAARKLALEPSALVLTKANRRASVHRPSYLDYIGVKRYDAAGEVCGEHRFLGLYTSSGYAASPRKIPIVRRKVEHVLGRARFPRGSHNHKALVEILETYPRDELFQMSHEDLFRLAMGILHHGESQRVRLFVRRDAYGRFLSCLVFVPRERYTTENRERMQEILRQAAGGATVDYSARVNESPLARLHLIVYTEPGEPRDEDWDEVEDRLVEATRLWKDELFDALIDQLGEERGRQLFSRYGDAFPAAYQEDFAVARAAVVDLSRFDELETEADLRMSLYRPLEAPDGFLRFKLFKLGEPISLSDLVPVLENMGVRVADERPYDIAAAGGRRGWIYDIGLTYSANGEPQADQVREIFQEAFAAVWRGHAENDGFNRLVLGAQLTWRQITIVRALCKYLRQAGSAFSDRYMERTLAANSGVARLLVELFEARFNPAVKDRRSKRLVKQIGDALDAVPSLDEDRILRSFVTVCQAILRTNYFQTGADGAPKPYLAFKLDPAQIPELPLPRPQFEVFVSSPRTEGVHLRGGRVARGGIRWSDRREDFRTEVLGLMKAQMVKNAVIVPVGAKGGFVVKRPPRGGDRAALAAEVLACYRLFISGLLDLTDNMVAGEVVPPADVVRYDADDTYLVVAADKGTATFSDEANAIAGRYGYWLGDAFASGGSSGYDHKEMGITAAGAWQSVKRHFRELGQNTQTTDFTVMGVGDMSGDVFGNGMLLSRHIRLVAAFNHQHVFVDPTPDAEASFAERERLFALPRSSWADYDASLLSPGGGVYPRAAKSIALSAEARKALGIEEGSARMTPNELIRAVLRAPVDLFWNGGIGTYVKASSESHGEVGDRANDAVRIDASDLRCRVVGEGGNLGLTQPGRIEYALAGGRVNTDAIDNSGGVNCSDREVNIKILLDAIVSAGDMTGKQRDILLAEMTAEVRGLVLADSYGLGEALSLALAQAPSMLDVHARLMRSLEEAGRLNRRVEMLPDSAALVERRGAGLGLTAPELAVLSAYGKLTVYEELLDSDLPEDPYLESDLRRYFPHPLSERFEQQMQRHSLRREIVATYVANSLVNRAGTTFAFRLGEETSATVSEIARAYAVARAVFDLRSVWDAIEALDDVVSPETQVRMLLDVRKLVERATRWLLGNRRRPLEIAGTVAHFSPGVAAVSRTAVALLDPSEREAVERIAVELREAGVPPDLAERVAALGPTFSALDAVEVSGITGRPVEEVAPVYFALGSRLRLHEVRDRVAELPRDTRWQALARAALRDDLYGQHRALTAAVLGTGAGDLEVEARIEAWFEANAGVVERALKMLQDITAAGTFDLATLSVALREVRNLVQAAGAPVEVEEAPAPPSGANGAGSAAADPAEVA